MWVQEGALQPTMVLLVPFCPNNDNEALTFLHQWKQHATPVNVAGYLFNSQNTVGFWCKKYQKNSFTDIFMLMENFIVNVEFTDFIFTA